MNGGACSSVDTDIHGIGSPGFVCTCFPGFAGVTCEINLRENRRPVMDSREELQNNTFVLTSTHSLGNESIQSELPSQMKNFSVAILPIIIGGFLVVLLGVIVYTKLKDTTTKSIIMNCFRFHKPIEM